MQRWEHFEHEADMGVRGFGSTPSQAFEQAALAMLAVVTELSRIEPHEVVEVECAGDDLEPLLPEWLNALVYEMATRRMLFSRFEVKLDERGLHGRAWGEPVDTARHLPAVEVKGATYTMLRVAPVAGGGWLAQCVVDV